MNQPRQPLPDDEAGDRRPPESGARGPHLTEGVLLRRSANIYASSVLTGAKPRPSADEPPPEPPAAAREERKPAATGLWSRLRRALGGKG